MSRASLCHVAGRGVAEIGPSRALSKRAPPETADGYPHVVAVLDFHTRVIECAAGIQWIVQRRVRDTATPWHNVSFCRTRAALLRCAGGDHPALLALPDRFSDEAR